MLRIKGRLKNMGCENPCDDDMRHSNIREAMTVSVRAEILKECNSFRRASEPAFLFVLPVSVSLW